MAGLAIILVAGVLYLTLWWYARSETVSSVLAAWGADRPWVRVLVAAGLVAFGAWFYWHLWGFGVP